MKKISQEEVRKYLKSHGGWELLSDYIGVHEPMLISCGEYKATVSFASFKANRSPILFGVKNPFYKENIAALIKSRDDKVVFVDARGVRKSGKYRMVVDMIDSNGHQFSKTLEHILNDGERLCCKLCSRRIQTDAHRERFTDEWFGRIDKTKYKILETPEFIVADSKIDVEELSTGYRINGNIRTIIKGRAESFNVFSNKKYFVYNLNVYAEKNGLESEPLEISDPSASQTKALFKCSCGNTFERSVYKWMDGRDVCPRCCEKQSRYERTFRNYLDSIGLEYKMEYRFNGCRDIKPLPFDFYLPQFDCLIEIDGKQHFEPIRFGNDSADIGKRFELQKKHDEIKEKYCEANNILLLRIPYFCFDNGDWKEKFNNFIKPLGE